MQSDCQNTHVGRALLIVTLLWKGQHLAGPQSCATSSGTCSALINMLDTVLFVTGGFNNWVTLANEFSCTVFLIFSVKIKILCSFNQIWNGQMWICVWGGRRNKQKKDQAWSKFYTNLKYVPPDTLRHVICYLVSSHILRCDHCSGIKRKTTFVEWLMSSLKYMF